MNYREAKEILAEANKPDGVYRLADYLHAKHFLEGWSSHEEFEAELNGKPKEPYISENGIEEEK